MNRKLSYPLVILGFLWSIFLVCHRLFRNREEKALGFLLEQSPLFLSLLFLFSFLWFLWRTKTFFLGEGSFFPPFLLSWVTGWLDSPSHFYEFLRRKTPLEWGSFWLNLWSPLKNFSTLSLKKVIFFFYFLPILLPPWILLLEIGWDGPLKYYYHSLFLLLLPLFLRVSIFLGLREREALLSLLEGFGLRLDSQEAQGHFLSWPPDLPEDLVESLLDNYRFLLSMKDLFQDLSLLIQRYSWLNSWLTSLVYSLAWGSLLFFLPYSSSFPGSTPWIFL